MKILLVTHFFPPTHNAGTENYTWGLAHAFLGRGHDVHVICAGSWSAGDNYWNGVSEDIYRGIPVTRINLNWTRASNPNLVLFDSAQVENWFDLRLESLRPDVVHITSTYTLSGSILRSLKRASAPTVLTLMDFWFLCPRNVLLRGDGALCNGQTTAWECQDCLLLDSGIHRTFGSIFPLSWIKSFWQWVSRRPRFSALRGARGMALDMQRRKSTTYEMFQMADVVISHSSFVRQTFIDAGFPEHILHLPNGHEMEWARSYQGKTQASEVRIGYSGQISANKGIHVLIEAFRRAQFRRGATLRVWGDLGLNPSYTESLRRLAGNERTVSFMGRFEREQLSNVFSELDVLVVPSLWFENAPLVIQEAFATGTPVVTTNIGGMAEAVGHELNGLLFSRGDIGDLARQLERLVNEPSLLDRLRKGIPAVKSIDEEVDELEKIYREVRFRYKAVKTI